MHLLISRTNSPYHNLATEEYLLTSNKYPCPIVFLWQNENTIVIGRNQNILAEINLDPVENDLVNVVRRNTGGGAVFQDLGNLCFSLIAQKNKEAALSPNKVFEECLTPVITLLQNQGLNVKFSGRNDLEIDGAKISGNAQLQTPTKTLAHGTILYDVDLNRLEKYLNVNPLKLQSKKVKSVRARVINIKNLLPVPWTMETFINNLAISYAKNDEVQEIVLDDEDWLNIDQLVAKKYSTWEWNFGKNQSFMSEKEVYWPEIGLIKASLDTDDGIIKDLNFEGDFLGSLSIGLVTKCLIGQKLNSDTIRLVPLPLLQDVFGEAMTHEKLVHLLFQ
ncbi:lipoate-protein ligase A [Entomoplasma freundtii]|uniref:lipoate--protein ligase n=1 Tax=Entomoplasma freundtii TaxID=74700 RepID=A0A2K8NQV8_9MOLU|nr:lipoate--protein ligase [Entomoplasma freundtii]ATZ16235.1 lipoate protein ligase A [Entomoplasma freundtii]TDY56864.1 lipoate-protein ligase A [Entomoplasma freundtii]